MIDYSLYLCTNSDINLKQELSECVKQAIAGGTTIVQVREKDKTTQEYYEVAKSVKRVTDLYNVPLIIDDNIDVALMVNADGIHIGQDDVSCVEARRRLGNDKIIGVTVTTLEEAKKAIKDGATYLGVGAIYKSKTKKEAKIVCKDELKRIIEYSSIPVVVIGGINEKTIPNLREYNISGYAMIRPILETNNIVETASKLKKIITENKNYFNTFCKSK